ncbi:hypothetical protein [Streptomyces sp. NPDC057580]
MLRRLARAMSKGQSLPQTIRSGEAWARSNVRTSGSWVIVSK